MEQLKEIIARRAAPGVLILDHEDRLQYSNQEALEMLLVLKGAEEELALPPEILRICADFRGLGGVRPVFGVIRDPGGVSEAQELHYALRALPLGHHAQGEASHVMVLMEKVIRNRRVDVEKARQKYQLSKREAEVVQLICQGLGNKEISGTIFISEFTVKDHIKSIMRKMGAATRNEIFALLL